MTYDQAYSLICQVTEPQAAGKITCEGYAHIFEARRVLKVAVDHMNAMEAAKAEAERKTQEPTTET